MVCGCPQFLMYNNGVSIQELARKFKDFLTNTDVVLILIILSTAILSFLLGRASVMQKESSIQNFTESNPKYQVIESKPSVLTSTSTANHENTQYVASKSGTKYHLPWCAGAKQIKEENKIFFNSKDEAERAGYTPAGNCKGI